MIGREIDNRESFHDSVTLENPNTLSVLSSLKSWCCQVHNTAVATSIPIVIATYLPVKNNRVMPTGTVQSGHRTELS